MAYGAAPDPDQFDPSGQRLSSRETVEASGSIFGKWISADSQNVNRFRYDPHYDLQTGKRLNTGTIQIEFLSLALYEYANRPVGDFMDMFESSSKGRFTYYEVRGPGSSASVKGKGIWPSKMLRGPQRSAAEVRRLQKLRAPTTRYQKKRTYTRGGKRAAYGKGGAYIGSQLGKLPPPLPRVR